MAADYTTLRCAHCGGNIVRRRDIYGIYQCCLQCAREPSPELPAHDTATVTAPNPSPPATTAIAALCLTNPALPVVQHALASCRPDLRPFVTGPQR